VTGEISPEDLPDTLPGYQINLIAEFTINNAVIASASAGSMGSELHEQLGFYDPRFGWGLSTNKPIAGEYQAIALDLQGSSPEYAAQLQAELDTTKAQLENGDATQLANMTKHHLVGDLLEATIFSYFALNNIQDDIAAQQAGIVNYRAPSYGKFSTSLSTSYFYGTPRNVSTDGMVMDVDRVFNINVDKNNDKQKRLDFSKTVGGRYSAMEHLGPEIMLSTEDAPAHGISAVKAIAIASSQGQKIWTINQANLDLAMAEINLNSETEREIRNSVNTGKVVTTHEQRLNFNGWIGEGYIILDPETGAGAYKIAGGGNGGKVDVVDLINNVIGWANTLIDVLVEGMRNSQDIAAQAFKFFLTAVGKLFSAVTNTLGNIKTGFDLFSNCPIDVIFLVLPVIIFLTLLTMLLAFLLSGFIAILFGVLSGLFTGWFSGRIISICKKT